MTLEEFWLPFIAKAFAALALLFICIQLTGAYLSRFVKQESAQYLQLFLGFAAVSMFMALSWLGLKSVAVLLLPAFGFLVFSGWKIRQAFKLTFFKPLLVFLAVLLFNLVTKVFYVYDFKNIHFFTLLDDQYSYVEQYNLMALLKTESIFKELELGLFNFPIAFKAYHFIEFYFTWFLKSWFPDLPTFKVYQLGVVPFFLTFSEVFLVYLFANFFPGKQKIILALILLAFFSFSTYLPFYNPIGFLSGIKSLHSILHFFPMQTMQTDFFISPVNFSSSIKLPVFLLYLGMAYALLQVENKAVLVVYFLLLLISNYAFYPFLILFLFGIFFIEGKERAFFFPAMLAVFCFLFFFMMKSQGHENVSGSNPFKYIQISFSGIKKQLYARAFNFTGNYFALAWMLSALLLWHKKSGKYLLIFAFLGIFPFLFLLPASIFSKLIFVYVLAFVGLVFWFCKMAFDEAVFYAGFTTLCLLGFMVNMLNHVFDLWQVFYYPLIGFILFAFLVAIVKVEKRVSSILLLLFISANVYCNVLYFNRFYFRDHSNQPFIKSYLAKAKGLSPLSVYLSNPTDPSFPVLEKCGFDIQNESDSIFSSFISIENIDASDTIKLKSSGAWATYQHIPINVFKKSNPTLSLETCKLAFLKKYNVRTVFISNRSNRAFANFINPYLADSLENKVENYKVLFLRPWD